MIAAQDFLVGVLMRLAGSYHCDKVRFELKSKHPSPFNLCYCSICRNTAASGGLAIHLGSNADALRIKGEKHFAVYQARVADARNSAGASIIPSVHISELLLGFFFDAFAASPIDWNLANVCHGCLNTNTPNNRNSSTVLAPSLAAITVAGVSATLAPLAAIRWAFFVRPIPNRYSALLSQECCCKSRSNGFTTYNGDVAHKSFSIEVFVGRIF